ncbi:MAG: dienelactone hydrolase family protein [Actinomycetota bacterium]
MLWGQGLVQPGRPSAPRWRNRLLRTASGPPSRRPGAPVRLAPHYRCPVLGLFGGADELIPAEEVDRFRRALDEAGVPSEIVVYAGAPHSFFDRAFAEHHEACDDAWRRVLGFVGA